MQEQRLSSGGIIALIGIAASAPPIATDIYLPALPDMPEFFHTTEAILNFTLVGFFFFMAVGILLAGPLSDKLGRKRPLLVTVSLFAAAALLCSTAKNVGFLIACRIVQGIAGGGMVALSMALVKDCFEEERRAKVLVITQIIGVVAPMVAPVIGAGILQFTTWQGVFVIQAVLGALAYIPLARLTEPLPPDQRSSTTVIRSLGGLVTVGKNKAFFFLLCVVAVGSIPFMAYISSASYIYIDYFGLNRFQYSGFFAANASLSAIGAILVVFIGNKISARTSLLVTFPMALLGGILLLLFGHSSPWAFLAFFGIYALAGSYQRPIVTNILLDQQEGDTGSASSLINFTITVFNCIGMVLATIPLGTYIRVIAVLITITLSLATLGFLAILKSSLNVKGL